MSWLDTVPISTNVFVFQAALLCEDCGRATIEVLSKKGVVDDGDSGTFPQGPYGDGGGEADGAQFCDRGRHCANAVEVTGGHKIGCPLDNPLTNEGAEALRESILRGVLAPEKLARMVGRLLFHIWKYAESPIVRIPPKYEDSKVLAKAVGYLRAQEHSEVDRAVFTDLVHVFGTAQNPYKTTVWRLTITDDGGFTDLSCVYLPPSEIKERRAEELVAEAAENDAWE